MAAKNQPIKSPGNLQTTTKKHSVDGAVFQFEFQENGGEAAMINVKRTNALHQSEILRKEQ